MIDITGLTKDFGLYLALQDVSLHIARGEFVWLTGANGAGKTTLLRILATLSRPTTGLVSVAGLDVVRQGLGVRACVGFLSHRPLLYDELTVEQNLDFYARMYALRDSRPARISEMLDLVGLSSCRTERAEVLSRGMQQRLGLARVLLHRPQVLLLDEPYTGLDASGCVLLDSLLADLWHEGRTLLVTTHNLERTRNPGRRVLVLEHGRLASDTRPAGSVSVVTHPAPASSLPEPVPLPSAWDSLVAILCKDLAIELHTKEVFSAMAVFALLAMFIFSFSLDLQGTLAQVAAPGVLWTAIAFAGTLAHNRAMSREQQSGGLEGIRLSPVDPAIVFGAKALGNGLLMLLVALVLAGVGSVLFDVVLFQPGFLVVLSLGIAGYAVVGTLVAAIAVNTRAREVLLPLLLLPLAIPLLLSAVRATAGLVSGLSLAQVNGWLRILVVYDLILAAVGLLTFSYVVEE